MIQKLRLETQGHWDGEFVVDRLVVTPEQLARYDEARARIRNMHDLVAKIEVDGGGSKTVVELEREIGKVSDFVLDRFDYIPDIIRYDDPALPFKIEVESNNGANWTISLVSRDDDPGSYALDGDYDKLDGLVEDIELLFGKNVAVSMFAIVDTLPKAGGKKAAKTDEK